ncbi:MAG: GPO family capsid scaffolding protein [Burkholderia gladioli]
MKFVRVATEGATTDGRAITRQQIQDMANTYDLAKYGARINVEHIRGAMPGGPFGAYGDVKALEARPVEDGKLGLFAQVDPTESLKALNKQRQKVYSSIEMSPNFAGTDKVYLMGLAVTDSPASLGTEMLQFAQQHPDVFKGRKQNPENLFSATVELDASLFADAPDSAPPPVDPASFASQVVAKFAELFGGKKPESLAPVATQNPPASGVDAEGLTQLRMLCATQQVTIDAQCAELARLATQVSAQTQEFTALKAKLEAAPMNMRTATTGGSGSEWAATDC